MKRKKVDLSLLIPIIFGLIIFLSGCAFLLYSFDKDFLFRFFPITLYIFAFISCLSYFISRKENDYEYLLLTLIYIICASLVYVFMDQGSLILGTTFSVFTFLFMLNRIYKISNLRKTNSFMWLVKTYGTVLICILGILTSYNLYTSGIMAHFIIGYYNITFAIIISAEALTELFVSENKIKRFALESLNMESNLETVKESNKDSKKNKKKTGK